MQMLLLRLRLQLLLLLLFLCPTMILLLLLLLQLPLLLLLLLGQCFWQCCHQHEQGSTDAQHTALNPPGLPVAVKTTPEHLRQTLHSTAWWATPQQSTQQDWTY
jgi:hypothetical protein